jgi:EpsI family protein
MIGRCLVLLACLVGGAALTAKAERPEPVPVRTSFSTFPMQVEEWRGVQQPPLEPAVLAVLGVDDYLTRAYFTPDRVGVGLYIGYWGSQRQGDTMHSPLNCLPGSGWEPVSQSTISMNVSAPDLASASEVVLNRYVVQKGLDRQLVVYWYQSHGRVVASEYWGKFYLIRDAVRLNRTDGALVRVISPVAADDTGERRAEQTAVQFVKALFPVLGSYLPT